VLLNTSLVPSTVRTTGWRKHIPTSCMSQPSNFNKTSWLTVFCSHDAFGDPSKGRIFFQNVARWLPNGFFTWVFEMGQSPGHLRLRQNRDEAHRVARELIDAKRVELQAGTPRRDLMSLLGSPPPTRSRESGTHVSFQ
jgi:hypothetical protein